MKSDRIRRAIPFVEAALAATVVAFAPESAREARWALPVAVVAIVLGGEGLRRLLPNGAHPGREGLKDLGDWVLRSAMNRTADAAPTPRVEAPSADRPSRHPAVPETVDHWFDALHHELLRTDEEVEAAYKMECDLNLAKDFQRAYLERPYPPVASGRLRLRFHHYYAPTMTLGGDFFDISPLGSDGAGVMIADVMGHGARSALITASLRSLISELAPHGRDVSRFMEELNRRYADMLRNVPDCLFVSAFYWVADLAAKKAFYTTAGHPAPFHVSRDRGFVHQLGILNASGMALGLEPDGAYPSTECPLQAGDLFLFFTDGVYETRDANREEFGEERMLEVLRSAMKLPARDVVDQLVVAVNAFAGDEPIEDDICIVAVEVVGEEGRRQNDE